MQDRLRFGVWRRGAGGGEWAGASGRAVAVLVPVTDRVSGRDRRDRCQAVT